MYGFKFRIQMDSIRQEKVQRFEEFVDRRLKPDLVRAIAERKMLLCQAGNSCRIAIRKTGFANLLVGVLSLEID
ncbi:hypothetical protein RHGRI_033836 [Rhododendron griersonianum]|uniref:Uncharacterized protein n=1 Tax=Rhododendron griersonianum TaxID=479676 RepID=A0AAV6I2P0_9ERIC|nr:hypothetical protein RHGRI_033836 [Rhododendron griersonianum]